VRIVIGTVVTRDRAGIATAMTRLHSRCVATVISVGLEPLLRAAFGHTKGEQS
jgi:hypothetical protein